MPEQSILVREFLYVDSDKVRSILAQLDDGIAESANSTQRVSRSGQLGLPKIISGQNEWSSEESQQRSYADAVFPRLEEALEARRPLS